MTDDGLIAAVRASLLGHDYFVGGDYADIVECYGDGPGGDAEYGLPGQVSLLDWGCALWSICDFRTPEGMMWGWDPHECCTRHALFPKNQTVKRWISDSLGVDYSSPFHDGLLRHPARNGRTRMPAAGLGERAEGENGGSPDAPDASAGQES